MLPSWGEPTTRPAVVDVLRNRMKNDEIIGVLDDMISLVQTPMNDFKDFGLRTLLKLLFVWDFEPEKVPNPNFVAPALLRTAAEDLPLVQVQGWCEWFLDWFFDWTADERKHYWTKDPLGDAETQVDQLLSLIPQLGRVLHVSDGKLEFRPEVDARERKRIVKHVRKRHRPARS